ncbi:MAG: methionyl-tRNA formyltransferase, partial [bacterium]
DVIEHFRGLAPDLLVIVAYGKILPRALIDIPRLGSINVHASLLPKYRGAAPINWAIANGERETGVTTMYINEGLDAGDMLLSASTPIGSEETALELHDRLATIGAALLTETVKKIEAGKIEPVPQDHSKATFAPILKKKDGRIDWQMPAFAIANRVRGFSPWPGTFTSLNQKTVRVHKAQAAEISHCEKPGTVIEATNALTVACGRGALCILELQSEGGRRMPATDFLRGHKIAVGTKFG